MTRITLLHVSAIMCVSNLIHSSPKPVTHWQSLQYLISFKPFPVFSTNGQISGAASARLLLGRRNGVFCRRPVRGVFGGPRGVDGRVDAAVRGLLEGVVGAERASGASESDTSSMLNHSVESAPSSRTGMLLLTAYRYHGKSNDRLNKSARTLHLALVSHSPRHRR